MDAATDRSLGRRLRRLGPRLGTVASAALLALAVPPFELHGLVWFAFVPWLWVVARTASAGGAVVQGLWLSGLFGSVAGVGVAPALAEYLQRSMALGAVGLLLHSFVSQPQLVLFAPAFRRLAARGDFRAHDGLVLVPAAALLYAGLEWASPKILRDTIGLVLHASPALRQVAELGGVRLLTALVVAVNVALFSVLRAALVTDLAPARRALAALPAASVAAALLLGAAAFGTVRLAQWSERLAGAERTIRVGLVQGNVPRDLRRRWSTRDPAAARESLGIYLRETDGLLRGPRPPELVVWPETAYPGIFRKPETREQLALNIAFDRWVAARGVPIVFGAYDVVERSGERLLLNGLFFVAPEPRPEPGVPSPMQVHHKSRLFPIGEYLPFVDRRLARDWLPGAGALSSAGGPGVHELEIGRDRRPIRLGPAICYEDLFAAHTAALARLGAEVFVNVSSDTWFGDSGVSRLHLIAAQLRSVEIRLPQVRATNSGYSALILPTGELAAVSAFGRTQTLEGVLPVTVGPPTPVARWGDWFGPAGLALGGVATLLWTRRRASEPPEVRSAR